MRRGRAVVMEVPCGSYSTSAKWCHPSFPLLLGSWACSGVPCSGAPLKPGNHQIRRQCLVSDSMLCLSVSVSVSVSVSLSQGVGKEEGNQTAPTPLP